MNRHILAALLALPTPAAAASGTPAVQERPVATVRLVAPMLNVAAIAPELAFYQQVMGLKLAMTLDHGTRREYMLRFSPDAAEAGLILLHDTAADAPRPLRHGDAFNRLVLRVTDMDGLVARLDAAAIPHGAPRTVARNYRMMTLSDPEGYVIEVVQWAEPLIRRQQP